METAVLRLVVITYNDWPLIQRCVSSCYDWVDEVVAVDGRYADFPGEMDYSNDGTVEYLMDLDKCHVIFASGLKEVEKRNLYLVGSEGDWYIMMDADEEWVGPPFSPDPQLDAYVTNHKREYPIHEMDRVRLFKHVPGLHYAGKHYWLRDARNRTVALVGKVGKSYRWEKLKDHRGYIQHHELKRPPERQRAKNAYYGILRKRETKIKEFL